MIVNEKTGEVIFNDEQEKEQYELAKRELNELALFEPWLDAKENYLTAKEQFEIVDKRFKDIVEAIFEKYSIKSLSNDYLTIYKRNGYIKDTWLGDKLTPFILAHKGNVEDFKKSKWVDGGLTIKYKEDKYGK